MAHSQSQTTRWAPDCESSLLDGLSPEQQQRLTQVLDNYLRGLERGFPADTATLVADHPDLAEVLSTYLDQLRDLHGAAAAFGGTIDDDSHADPSVARLGDFDLLGEVGRGGMGVVYEARQRSLDRRVAVKVLPFAAVLDGAQIVRFKHEAQAAGQLHHPNIVPVYAVGSERGVHYYAMQFIEGQPLDRVVRALRRLAGKSTYRVDQTTAGYPVTDSPAPPVPACVLEATWLQRADYVRLVIELICQAADALQAAHGYGIVHRDVKPSNLLLDGTGKLWVTDFGLARCQSDASLTRTGHIIGTRQYMSPEQARGRGALVDERSDVYSLGATLYELLTLEPVLPAEGEPLRLPGEVDPVRPRSLAPYVPRDLETVVLKAIATEREDRYQTAAALADDLRRVLAGEPIVARPPSLVDRASRVAWRHRRLVASAALVGLLALVGLSVAVALVQREKNLAQRNFARAEDNFRQAQDAVDQLGTRLAERLADVPGAEPVRRDLLEQTRDYYQRFIAQAGDDPALRAELALTYSKLGGVQRSMGETEAALAAQQEAVSMLRQLDQQASDPWKYRGRLATCLSNWGMALAAAGRTSDAREALDEALQLQQSLAEHAGATLKDRLGLALIYNNVGDLERQTGDKAAAEKAFRKAIALQQQLHAEHADDADVLRQLATSNSNLAAVIDDPAAALRLDQLAIDWQRKALALQPGDTQLQSQLALALNNLGAAAARSGDQGQAAQAYREAIELQKQLLRQTPLDRALRLGIAVSYNNLGLSATRQGDAGDAERCFRNALGFQEPLAAESPGDLELASSLGGVWNNLGIVLEELGQIDQAIDSYRRAIERQRLAFDAAPNVERYRNFLSKHYYNLGRTLRRQQLPHEAVQAALERKALWPQDAERLLSVAEELALADDLLQTQGSKQLEVQRCADLTIDTLRQAIAAGLKSPAEIQSNAAFAVVRNHPGFAELFAP